MDRLQVKVFKGVMRKAFGLTTFRVSIKFGVLDSGFQAPDASCPMPDARPDLSRRGGSDILLLVVQTLCGRNSAVECQLPKLDVVGSNPIARFRPISLSGKAPMLW